MDKRKIILISVIAFILIAVIAVGVYFITQQNNKNDEVGKLNNYYEKLKNTNTYTFSVSLDEKNNMYYTKQDGKAYIDSNYKGKNSKYIIKDGNTYLLKDSDKTYYTYANNETDLYKIELQIRDVKEKEGTTGKEKIENRKYKYEEFNILTEFYFGTVDTNNVSNVKTRFYFDVNDDLVYVKTIVDEKTEQLVKVEFSENANGKSFDIPSDYEEM